MIVAVALFMENMDSTVIATSLPAIAADLGTSPLTLKLAVTSYLLSLAVFIPISGWTADRFGTRTVFRAAIAVFVLGSIGCAASQSITQFVLARIVQGMGGAMMTPVGRLVLVRTIDRRALVDAMAWVSIPAMVGPLLGPPLGGFITTYASWHWIFLINVPIGFLGIGLVTRYIENIRAPVPDRFDTSGMVLSGIAVAGLSFGLSVAGFDLIPWPIVVALLAGGAIAFLLYLRHARHVAAPVLDFNLLKLPTFRASVLGGFLFRIGVGALPFLLPLLLQVGFRFTPIRIGHLHSDAWRHRHEDLGRRNPPAVWFSHRAHRQCGAERAVHRSLRHVRGHDADRRDGRNPAGWRLLPLAAVHRRQRHSIRRGAGREDEPRNVAYGGRAAGLALRRGGDRRAFRRNNDATQGAAGNRRFGLPGSLPRGRSDYGCFGAGVPAPAA
jgi:MFS family permease